MLFSIPVHNTIRWFSIHDYTFLNTILFFLRYPVMKLLLIYFFPPDYFYFSLQIPFY